MTPPVSIICLFIILTSLEVTRTIGLNGAVFTVTPLSNGEITIDYRISWQDLFHSDCGDVFVRLDCLSGCSDSVYGETINCTDSNGNNDGDWMSGLNRIIYQPQSNYVSFGFSDYYWIYSSLDDLIHGSLNVKLAANLTVRDDDGRINTSPTTDMIPIIRLQTGCNHTIHIPVGDVDGDVIKCRWSSGYDECDDTCNGKSDALPDALIDEEQCSITYVAGKVTGIFGVALQIEDYIDAGSTTPLSSVPLHFFVDVYDGPGCLEVPKFKDPTPDDGACIEIEVGSELLITIEASSKQNVNLHAVTITPVGVEKSLEDTWYESERTFFSMNITWVPSNSDEDRIHIMCFYIREETPGIDSFSFSETRCIRIAVIGSILSFETHKGLMCKPGQLVCPLPNLRESNIDHVTPTAEEYRYGDSVEYFCSEGYRFANQSQVKKAVTCTENGVFESFQQCIRIECSLPNVLNTSITYIGRTLSVYYSSDTVHYACVTGHHFLQSSDTSRFVTCTNDGTFENFHDCVPTICPLPNLRESNIDHVTPTAEEYRYGDSVEYFCSEGYKFANQSQVKKAVTCTENGVFESFQQCIRIECSLPNVSNTSITYIRRTQSVYYSSDTVQYACVTGHHFLQSSDTSRFVTCTNDGTFENFHDCVPTICPLPNLRESNIDHVTPTAEEYRYGDGVEYFCSEGYRFTNQSQVKKAVTCTENGVFESFQQCIRIECSLPNVLNTSITYIGRTLSVYYSSDTVHYACVTGHHFLQSSDTSRFVTCTNDGTFENFHDCVPTICPLPNLRESNIDHVTPTAEEYRYGDGVEYFCSEGYRFTNQSQVKKAVTCTENGEFESFQQCIRIECSLPNVLNTSITYIGRTLSVYYSSDTVHYACVTGHHFLQSSDTSRFVTCTNDGTFENFHDCVPTICPLPNLQESNIDHVTPTAEEYRYGDSVEYFCSEGYTFANQSQVKKAVTCTENGVFESFLQCIRIVCRLPNVQDLNIDHVAPALEAYNYGDSVVYFCDSGYRLVNQSIRTATAFCTEKGILEPFQQCKRIECLVPDVSNRNIAYTDTMQMVYYAGDAVRYGCHRGYRFVGSNEHVHFVTCTESGQFESFQHCILIECPLPDVSNTNIKYIGKTQRLYYSGDNITYSCHKGYRFLHFGKHRQSVTCMQSGEFESFQDCIRIECPLPDEKVTNIEYLGASKKVYYSDDTVTYGCRLGFRFVNRNKYTYTAACMESGVFERFQHCVQIECPLPDVAHSNITYIGTTKRSYKLGETVTYGCRDGYRFVNWNKHRNIVTCTESGTFESFQICIRIECPLPDVSKSSFTYIGPRQNVYHSGDIVTYGCRQGHRFVNREVHRNTVTCMESGTFESFQNCLRIECQLPEVSNTAITYIGATKKVYYSSQSVTYGCRTGYKFVNRTMQTKTMTCMETGEFQAFQVCHRIECPLTDISNTHIKYMGTTKNVYYYGDAVGYTCRSGYRFVNRNIRRNYVTCTGTETFESFQNCVRIDCGLTRQIPNGKVLFPNGTTFGAEALYECNIWYKLAGEQSRQCLQSELWSNREPVCIEEVTCPGVSDKRNTFWNKTLAGTTIEEACGGNFTGNRSRHCDIHGNWKEPWYKCVRPEIQSLNEKIGNLNDTATEETINEVVETLTKVTKTKNENDTNKLTSGEVVALSSSLEFVANALNSTNNTAVKNENITNNFLESCDNLIDSSNKESWTSQTAEKETGAEKVLQAVDVLVEAIGRNLQENKTTIVKKNMALEIKKIAEEETEVVFPQRDSIENTSDSETDWIRETTSSIRLNASALTNSSVKYVTTAVMYKDLSEILSSTVTEKKDKDEKEGNEAQISEDKGRINGPILAMSIIPSVEKFDPPITIIFQHIENNLTNPACSFWKFNGNETGWFTEGCHVAPSSKDVKDSTVCECDHLTNFAVLMSPFKEVDSSSVALEIISILGIAVSIFCLLLTLIIHVLFWKILSNERTVILMNLCIALIISNVTFLAGINATANPTICAAVAAFLQYIYLVVFCVMLVEGIIIAITILYVFKTMRSSKMLLIPAWVVPLVIVGISLWATGADGYGNKGFCWLSIQNSLIWTFVGPALCILVCNVVCLALVFRAMFNTTAMEAKKSCEKVKTGFRCLCVLLPLMGLSWIFGIFYVDERSVFVQYIFTILNAFQGFFIFLFHCLLNQQVKKALELRVRRYSATRSAFKTVSTASNKEESSSKSHKPNQSRSKSIEEDTSLVSRTEGKSVSQQDTDV